MLKSILGSFVATVMEDIEMPAIPLWLQILLAIFPIIPQEVAAIQSIFAKHAGTSTGDKIVNTFSALVPLAAAAASFQDQHIAAKETKTVQPSA